MSAQRLAPRPAARQRGRFLLAQRAMVMGLGSASFRELLLRIERDPLFLRLLGGTALGGSLIRRRALSRMKLRPSAAPEKAEAVPASTAGFDLGRTIEEHAEAVEALRELGYDKAKQLLATEELIQRQSLLEAYKTEKEARTLLLALLEHLSLPGVISPLERLVPAQGAPCAPVARLEPGPGGKLAVVPLVSTLRSERYEVDYEGLAEARRRGEFSEEEADRLPALLAEVESINFRGDTLHKVLCGLADAHAAFFRSRRRQDLAPLTQLDLSRTIGVHPSAVSRAVACRSLLTPWGEERRLADLFPGRGGHGMYAVESVLARESGLSDRQVAERVLEIFGCRISRRSAAIYRSRLSIPNSYRR